MHHDFVGSLQNLVNTEVSQESLDGVVLQVPITSMELESIVHNVKTLVGGELLGHGAIHGLKWIVVPDGDGTVSDHQTRSFEVGGHLGKLELNVLVATDWLIKLLPLSGVLSGDVQALGCTTEGTACNVESSSIKTT